MPLVQIRLSSLPGSSVDLPKWHTILPVYFIGTSRFANYTFFCYSSLQSIISLAQRARVNSCCEQVNVSFFLDQSVINWIKLKSYG